MESSSSHSSRSAEELQKFLDSNQYSETHITHYEVIFGRKFVSTGGISTTEEFTKLLDLNENSYVLDLGCGLGGSAFFMAENYSSKVLGIDLSSNMIARANDYKKEMEEHLRHNVEFRIGDIMELSFPENTFDCIYSRECLNYIQQKEELFLRFKKWLKPGGRVLFSDYCLGEKGSKDPSKDFQEYISSRGYFMWSVDALSTSLRKAGFSKVVGEDRLSQCISILKSDNARLSKDKASILESISQKDYDELKSAWEIKLQRCEDLQQTWGLFVAAK